MHIYEGVQNILQETIRKETNSIYKNLFMTQPNPNTFSGK